MPDGALVQMIVNPTAGRRAAGSLIPELAERFRRDGHCVRIAVTQRPGHARHLAEQAARDRADTVITVGGDGTVRETAAGLADSGIRLLVVPCGTENIMGRYLGLRAEAAALYAAWSAGRNRLVDQPTMNGRHFLLMAGVGFDAEAVHRLSRQRRRHISYWSYVPPVGRALLERPAAAVEVKADGELVFRGKCLLFVGNVPRYALGLRLFPGAVSDDGLLDVCVLPCRWPGDVLRWGWEIWRGRHWRQPGVVYRQARAVAARGIDGRAAPVQTDGDPAGYLPIECEAGCRQVRFVCGCDGGADVASRQSH